MNIDLYAKGKESGESGITLHGASTLLVRTPGGFDPQTGAKMPPIERGLQRADLEAILESAQRRANEMLIELDRANAAIDSLKQLIADVDTVLAKAA